MIRINKWLKPHVVLCLLFPVIAFAETSVEWLGSQTNPDGSNSLATDIATSYQSTAESVRAYLDTENLPSTGISESLNFINSDTFHSTEYLSRKIIINAKSGSDVTALVDELIMHQNVDGGFGELPGYFSAAIDTAFALEAIAAAGQLHHHSIGLAVSYLAQSQTDSGAWSLAFGSEGSVLPTAQVLGALSYFRSVFNLNAILSAGQNYLLSRRLADAGWGELYITAQVVSALTRIAPDTSILSNTIAHLESQQLANGSWQGDVYVTALVTRAIAVYEARQAGAGTDNGTVAGYVVRAVSGEPIAGAQVSILGLPGASVFTNGEGYYSLPLLAAGNHTVTATAAGFNAGSVIVDNVAGELTGSPDIVLAYADDSGLMDGLIFEQADGAFLAGATVALSGAQTYSILTDQSGTFAFNEIVPGNYTVTVTNSGYYPVTGNVEIEAGQRISFYQGMVRNGAFQDDQPANITAQVVDGNDAQPLVGATLDLGWGYVGVSGTDGQLTIPTVPRGSYQASLTLAGYEPRQYVINFPAGSNGDAGTLRLFSVQDLTAASVLNVFGSVVDGLTGEPLSGVSVSVAAENLDTTSDVDGHFAINGIVPLEFDLTLSATGYESKQYTVSAEGYGDVNIELSISPAGDGSSASSFTGVISDADSGAVISGAEVSIVGTSFSTLTGADGSYHLSGIDVLDFTLLVSAAGYNSNSTKIDLSGHGGYQLNGALDAVQATTMQVVSVNSDSPSWAGNSIATFSASIANLLAEEQSGLITAEVFNVQGESISILVPYAEGGLFPESLHVFAADEVRNFNFPWDTGQFPAGLYTVVVRIAEPGTASREKPRGVVKSAYTLAGVTVNELAAIGGSASLDPPLTQAGADTPVSLRVLVRNAGNVALAAQSYQLQVTDETAQVVYSVEANGEALAVSAISMLDFGQWIPTVEGNLSVQVAAVDSTVSGAVVGNLYVGDKASGTYMVSPSVVPEGTHTVRGTVDLQGVDTATGSSTDPLFALVRQAVNLGGSYVGAHVEGWQNRNQCLGCHIQTQSLMGLASSLNKGDIDPESVEFAYNAVASSQQSNGMLANSHTLDYGKTATLLGFWSLAAWPDKQQSFRTQYMAASYLHDRRSVSEDRVFWSNDHRYFAWWYNDVSTTAMTAIGLADVLTSAGQIDTSAVHEYRLNPEFSLGAEDTIRNTTMGPDGMLYALMDNGNVRRINLETGAGETILTDSCCRARGIRVASDGTIYISGFGYVNRVNPNGSVDRVYSQYGWLMDMEPGDNGDLYVSDYSNSRILKISSTGEVSEVVNRNRGIKNPIGLARDRQGRLLIANYSNYQILALNSDNSLSVVSGGLSYKPMRIAIDADESIYVTTESYNYSGYVPRGMFKITPDGVVDRITQKPEATVISVSIDANRNIWVANESNDTLDKLVSSVLQPTQMPDYQADLEGAARYLLYNYTGHDSDTYNITHAMRMLGLAAAKPHITDETQLAAIDAALAYGDTLLRERQLSDGGWGTYTTYSSDPLVTAMVGMALDTLNPSPEDPVVRSAITYLLQTQAGDGSWFNNSNGLSTRLAATSYVMAYMPKALDRLGGIDVDLRMSIPSDVTLSNFTTVPTTATPLANGGVDYHWQILGVTGNGRSVSFDVQLQDLELNETRKVATSTHIEFQNSFTDELVNVAIDIPSVTAKSEMSLTLGLDGTTYQAFDDVMISSLLSNNGVTTSNAALELYIRPLGGEAFVASLPTVSGLTLDASGQLQLTDIWNSTSTLAGDYEVFGRLVDSLGRVLDEDTVPFSLTATSIGAASSVQTDKPVYAAWDSVVIDARVTNTGQNTYLPATLIELTVTAPDQTVVMFESRNQGQMTPAAIRDQEYMLGLFDAAAGLYSVNLVVKHQFSHNLLSQSNTSFEVVRKAIQGLEGSMTVDFDKIYEGEVNACHASVTNLSADSINDLVLTHQLVDLELGTVIAETEETLAQLAGSGQHTYRRDIDGTLSASGYTCLLKATLNGETRNLSHASFVVLPNPNTAPVADAGFDQHVALGEHVTLDASASNDVDGNELSYHWTMIGSPLGSTAILSDITAVMPTFDVDLQGSYVYQLIVNDGTVNSEPDTVIINVGNVAPVANAGADRHVMPGDTVQLDGSASTDVDGDTLSFQWSIVESPVGSAAILSDVNAIMPEINIDLDGRYALQLVVSDGELTSDPNTVVLSTYNLAPIADAGLDRTINTGDTITLDGSGSSDANGDLLGYRWSLINVPDGSIAVLLDETTLSPSITFDLSGIYIAQLIVNDAELDSLPDTVVLNVENIRPVANAGPDLSLSAGSLLSLDGSASFDADNDLLNYQWYFTTLPDGASPLIDNASSIMASYSSYIAGLYVGQLIVDDGTLASEPDTAVINVIDDVGPISSNVMATPNPVDIHTSITLTALVDDSKTGGADIQSAEYRIDDGAYMPMVANDALFDSMSESVTTSLPAFGQTGVYQLCVRGTDALGNTGADECMLLAVYDPEGGFVTGGGWIDSPAGACRLTVECATAIGKANFGFNSKYKKGAKVPTGNTNFVFKDGGIHFKSNSYDWLVVAGAKAKYKGVGTINGTGDYGFMISAIDAKLTNSTDRDLFRIKIWDRNDADRIVYDNEIGKDENGDPTTAIGGGSIVIHK